MARFSPSSSSSLAPPSSPAVSPSLPSTGEAAGARERVLAPDLAVSTFIRQVPPQGCVAGLDVGRRRVGLAVCDSDQRVAVASRVCLRRGQHTTLVTALRERGVIALVVGWPIHMTGKISSRCQSVRRLVGDLKASYGVPVLLWDERLTSAAARRLDADPTDAQVAAIILQSALDRIARAPGGSRKTLPKTNVFLS